MIKFAGIAPHPPILIPAIGKENVSQLAKTARGFEALENELAMAQIDTLLVISPHGLVKENFYTINSNPDFVVNFEAFGDFATSLKLKGDIVAPAQIKEAVQAEIPLKLISDPLLDHGCGVPLFLLLSKRLKNIKIIPLYYSFLDRENHFEFGRRLKKFLQTGDKKFGILASGDLSHRLTATAPAGYSPKGAKFDQKLVELIKAKKTKEVLGLSEELIEEAGECGLRSILILLGVLDGIEYTPEILSYEGPFGVGYAVVNFKF